MQIHHGGSQIKHCAHTDSFPQHHGPQACFSLQLSIGMGGPCWGRSPGQGLALLPPQCMTMDGSCDLSLLFHVLVKKKKKRHHGACPDSLSGLARVWEDNSQVSAS